MQRLKAMGFLPIDTAINNHVKLSCLIGIYLESWFSWLEGGVQKTLRKKGRKQTE